VHSGLVEQGFYVDNLSALACWSFDYNCSRFCRLRSPWFGNCLNTSQNLGVNPNFGTKVGNDAESTSRLKG
jgi:hypothetical protein